MGLGLRVVCSWWFWGLSGPEGGDVAGLGVQVQGSAEGKYRVELSRFLLLKSVSFLMNVGQVRLQLGWLSVLHEAHFLSVEVQRQVLWCPVQFPHVSCSLMQSLAMWFQPWHLRQRIGSHLLFSVWHLQITRPLVIALFAALVLLNVR